MIGTLIRVWLTSRLQIVHSGVTMPVLYEEHCTSGESGEMGRALFVALSGISGGLKTHE